MEREETATTTVAINGPTIAGTRPITIADTRTVTIAGIRTAITAVGRSVGSSAIGGANTRSG